MKEENDDKNRSAEKFKLRAEERDLGYWKRTQAQGGKSLKDVYKQRQTEREREFPKQDLNS